METSKDVEHREMFDPAAAVQAWFDEHNNEDFQYNNIQSYQ